jgi:hypothetical protein
MWSETTQLHAPSCTLLQYLVYYGITPRVEYLCTQSKTHLSWVDASVMPWGYPLHGMSHTCDGTSFSVASCPPYSLGFLEALSSVLLCAHPPAQRTSRVKNIVASAWKYSLLPFPCKLPATARDVSCERRARSLTAPTSRPSSVPSIPTLTQWIMKTYTGSTTIQQRLETTQRMSRLHLTNF